MADRQPVEPSTEYIDTATAIEAFAALRQHGLGLLPASILAAGIVVADAITGRT